MSQVTNSPQTMADDATVGTVAWVNPDNAKVSDDVYATAALTTSARTHYLKATNFGFSIPVGATINGILVEVEVKDTTGSTQNYRAQIVKGGTGVGSEKFSSSTINQTDQYLPTPTTGGSTDLWGQTWIYSDINDATFGVGISCGFATNNTFSVDHIRITVYYTEVSTGTRLTATGRLTANNRLTSATRLIATNRLTV